MFFHGSLLNFLNNVYYITLADSTRTKLFLKMLKFSESKNFKFFFGEGHFTNWHQQCKIKTLKKKHCIQYKWLE